MRCDLVVLAFLFAFLTSGCSAVGVTRLIEAQPRSADCHLDVYSSASEIKRPYKVVCLLDSRTGTTLFHRRTGAAAVDNARRKACHCGAHAILISQMDTEGMSMARWGQGKALIRAIRYLD